MSSFCLTAFHKTILATDVNGQAIAFSIKDMAAMKCALRSLDVTPLAMPEEKVTVHDIRGAWDGANTVIKLEDHLFAVNCKPETLRVRETAENMMLAFKNAGLPTPTVTRSLGAKVYALGESARAMFVAFQL